MGGGTKIYRACSSVFLDKPKLWFCSWTLLLKPLSKIVSFFTSHFYLATTVSKASSASSKRSRQTICGTFTFGFEGINYVLQPCLGSSH
jgi:hypothetical protein